MRKFTKEITALLATAAIGAAAGSIPASSKESIRSSGSSASSRTNNVAQSTESTIMGTTAAETTTYLEGTTVSTTTTAEPELQGVTQAYDVTDDYYTEGTSVSSTTTEEPTTMGTTVGEYESTTTTYEYYLEGTTVSSTTTQDPTLMGTMVGDYETTTTVTTTEEPPLIGEVMVGDGDINSDGDFDLADVISFQQYMINPKKISINKDSADITLDGKVDIFDLIAVKRMYINEKMSELVKPEHESVVFAPYVVIADDLKMYLGPDSSYRTVTTIPKNEIIEEVGYQDGNYRWIYTEYKGNKGWIRLYTADNKAKTVRNIAMVDKPVIYLYPEEKTDVHVELDLKEADLATTYPKYNNGWDVTAYPDGTLLNKADGTHHKYLFWDAVNSRTEFDFSKGFCVAGEDTESFLKEKLTAMGMTENEMNEFIVYWLPRMEHNKYNLIAFQNEAYTDACKLNITPEPDSLCRIFMAYTPLDKAVDIEPQQFEKFERKGFSVLEWGGSEIKKHLS